MYLMRCTCERWLPSNSCNFSGEIWKLKLSLRPYVALSLWIHSGIGIDICTLWRSTFALRGWRTEVHVPTTFLLSTKIRWLIRFWISVLLATELRHFGILFNIISGAYALRQPRCVCECVSRAQLTFESLIIGRNNACTAKENKRKTCTRSPSQKGMANMFKEYFVRVARQRRHKFAGGEWRII